MRKHFYLAWLIIILCITNGFNMLHAVEVTDYTEGFTGLSTSKHEFAPPGWGHIVESVIGDYAEEYVTYNAVTSGGKTGAYLKAGSQVIGSDWGTEVNDLLVTPLVKGTISFYLKKISNSGSIKLFKCTKKGTTFSKGAEITFDLPTLSTSSWTKVSVTLTDEYSYVGIRLENMGIDEFYASQADIPEIKAIEIISTNLLSPSSIYAAENGTVTIHANFKVRNSGNVPLEASDYSFQMEKRTNPVTVMTPVINGSKNLAVGDTTTIDATCQYTLPDKTKGDRIAYDIREKLTNISKQIAYVEIIGYVATLDVRDLEGSSLSTSSVVDFETFKGQRSIQFTLKNTGGAPLSMTTVNLPAGFSIDNPTFSIPYGQSVTKTITLSGDPGSKEGTIEFVFEGGGTKSFTVKGTIVGPDTWFEDFEEGLPADWIIPNGSNWSIASEITTDFSKKHLNNSNLSSITSLITPKLSIKQGEALTFYVARKNQYTAPILQIRYSTDRQNWSEIISIETSDILPPSEKNFKKISLDTIPAGEYYISFESGYICLDNIYGYRRATVDHDFFIKSLQIPTSGIVNHPISATALIMNMTDKTETADAYKVELIEDGKVVAKASATELEAKKSKEFSLAYTPHSAGKRTLNLVLSTIGPNYSVSSSDYVIDIKEEFAADETVVGTVSVTGNNMPLRLGYNHSISETIYKKEDLGLNSGSNIIKIMYPYYSTDKDLITNISIWLENTTDGTPSTTALADTLRMTKVYYSKYTILKGGRSSELILTDFTLPEGFVYTGENLRVILRSSATTYSGSINFGYDNSISNTSIYKYKDPIADFPGAPFSTFTSGLPVIHLYTSKPVPNISGKVTADNQGLEGVDISLTSGEIRYKSTTDANGSYAIPVFQGNKEYVLSADKIGYTVIQSKLSIAESNLTEQDLHLEATGAKILNTSNLSVSPIDQSIALQGEGWTTDHINQLSNSLGNNQVITGIDLTHIDLPEGITATFDHINPNCLIYVKEKAVVPQSWKNVVKGGSLESIALKDKAPFNCIKPFIAKSISYERTSNADTPSMLEEETPMMETICLPYDVNALPDGCSVKEYTGCKNDQVNFTTKESQSIKANIPYLLSVKAAVSMNFQATDIEVVPSKPSKIENGNYSYCGTYASIQDGSAHNCYVFEGTLFQKAIETSSILPFRSYFKANSDPGEVTDLSISIDGSTPDQEFDVTIKVTAITGENLAGTPVKLEHLAYGVLYPTMYLSENGECTFSNVLKGINQLTIEQEGFAKYVDNNLSITKNTILEIVLKEPVRNPYALKAETNHDVRTGQSDILLNWNKETDFFYDDFESYEAFSIKFSPWTGFDGDKVPAAKLSGSYPNSELPQYATIFNPLTINPPLWYEYPVLRPYSGKQYAAFIRTLDGSINNDWLISPKIKVGVNNIVRFMAKAGDAYKEQFKVLISNTSTDIKEFKAFTPGNYETVDYQQWKTVQYDLSAYEGQEVYIAIQYVSKGYFMLMVDDFFLGPQNIEPSKFIRKSNLAVASKEKFVVYCDNDSIDTVTETAYLFKNLKAGTHKLGVKAKYQVSQSEISYIDANIPDANNYASVKINVTSNNELPVDGISVSYVNRSNGEQINDVVKNGISELKSLSKGEYLIYIAPDAYEAYTQQVTVDKNIVLNVQLKELIITPYNITTDQDNSAQPGKTDVTLKWNQDLGFSDGFESYPDFSQTFGEWTTVDMDKLPPYGINLNNVDITFPGVKDPSAGMVFNANATTPSMKEDGAISAPEGNRSYVFFSAQSGQSNDWLIMPLQTIRDGYVLRFVAKSYSSMYLETFEIGISDKKEISTFTILDEITATEDWVKYEVNLAAYAGKEMYIAIHYKSLDKFLMLFDSFYVGPSEESSSVASGNASYEIWLNGEKKTTTKENSYKFLGLANGTYNVGIKAIYKSGSSEMAQHTFICKANSINEMKENGFFVYGDNGSIRVESQVDHAIVRVCNAAGQTVYETSINEKITNIPMQPGVYILKISSGNKEMVCKTVVR